MCCTRNAETNQNPSINQFVGSSLQHEEVNLSNYLWQPFFILVSRNAFCTKLIIDLNMYLGKVMTVMKITIGYFKITNQGYLAFGETHRAFILHSYRLANNDLCKAVHDKSIALKLSGWLLISTSSVQIPYKIFKSLTFGDRLAHLTCQWAQIRPKKRNACSFLLGQGFRHPNRNVIFSAQTE